MRIPPAIVSFFSRFIPRRTAKHVVGPLLERREKTRYRPERFWQSWHAAMEAAEDGATIALDQDPRFARFHYNSVENAIIMALHGEPVEQQPAVLDVGAGAGHWADFYREVYDADRVTAVDIAPACVNALAAKYENEAAVSVRQADVADPRFHLPRRFDIVNAIGVLFHIVDDGRWERALCNLADHLREDGVLVVGCNFGRLTRNVQFHDTDTFGDWREAQSGEADVALVNKRIRSRRMWRRCAERTGLEIAAVCRTVEQRGIPMPENTVITLKHNPRAQGNLPRDRPSQTKGRDRTREAGERAGPPAGARRGNHGSQAGR